MRELFRRQPKFSPTAPGEETRSIPDDLWIKCPKCNELQYSRDAERSLYVCPRCGHHGRLSALQRIATLVDDGTFVEYDAGLTQSDPLDFVANGEAYRAKAASAGRKTHTNDALVCGTATICGQPVSLAVTEFGFMGASMGSVYGEKLVRAIERAIEGKLGLVTVSSSGGARMHESMFSLMQMAKTRPRSLTSAMPVYRICRCSLIPALAVSPPATPPSPMSSSPSRARSLASPAHV